VREPLAHNPRFLDENGKQLSEEREDFGLAAIFADFTAMARPICTSRTILRIPTSAGSMTGMDGFA